MAFIGFPLFRFQASADVPRTTKWIVWIVPICPADFDRIWANLRQWSFISGADTLAPVPNQDSFALTSSV
ncbi:hypothetical protein [Bradyrhizobium sp. BWA-3-5]|jgi:hypothetical protein|uniref:hypothetical protein n=1 Tax=Bradyrhizobium sp. BWA-3-5 TaxID=3080013 RepID=UPI00293E2A22|nr:hypothetical protein [Bradyrhizobium sp. BWA-3-5]WOH67400.1 hypothetical protein RX331_06510 [Bradyrhizobium sp. BWA-3-5]